LEFGFEGFPVPVLATEFVEVGGVPPLELEEETVVVAVAAAGPEGTGALAREGNDAAVGTEAPPPLPVDPKLPEAEPLPTNPPPSPARFFSVEFETSLGTCKFAATGSFKARLPLKLGVEPF